MTAVTAVPDFLKDEFTQEQWNELTPDEQIGMAEEGGEAEEEEEISEAAQRAADDAAREEAARAAATAQPEKTPEEIAAEEAEAAQAEEQRQQQENEQQQISPKPRGVVEQVLPDDYDDRVTANAKAIEDNDKAYDNGDISHEEWRTENRKLDRENRDLDRMKDRAELAIESAQNAMRNNWEANISAFLPHHPELRTSQVRENAFDHFLREETAPVIQAGNQPGMKEIEAAYAKFCAEFGITPPKTDPAPAPQKKGKEHVVPPSLGGVPAATTANIEDGRYAAIDRLEGIAYEEALAKLSPSELDAYSQR